MRLALAFALAGSLTGCSFVDLPALEATALAAPKLGKAPKTKVVKKKKKTKRKKKLRLRKGRQTKPTDPPPPADPPPADPPPADPPRTISDAEAQQILKAHNSARSNVGVAPLQWSAAVSKYAQEWATYLALENDCHVQHRENRPYGENLYWNSGGAVPSTVVSAWTVEAANYNHADNSCNGICGHYTQVVWANTTKVGCGVAACGNAEVWVCNYDPPGNYYGQSPY